jgi:hypothetical protein
VGGQWEGKCDIEIDEKITIVERACEEYANILFPTIEIVG